MSFDFMKSYDGPVVEGAEELEVVYAADQPQYNPLRVLRTNTAEGAVLSRWTLTDVQRDMVAGGGDIYLELLTFGAPLQPIRMAVGRDVSFSDLARARFPELWRKRMDGITVPDATGDSQFHEMSDSLLTPGSSEVEDRAVGNNHEQDGA